MMLVFVWIIFVVVYACHNDVVNEIHFLINTVEPLITDTLINGHLQ
jgi:hypothetical protein